MLGIAGETDHEQQAVDGCDDEDMSGRQDAERGGERDAGDRQATDQVVGCQEATPVEPIEDDAGEEPADDDRRGVDGRQPADRSAGRRHAASSSQTNATNDIPSPSALTVAPIQSRAKSRRRRRRR